MSSRPLVALVCALLGLGLVSTAVRRVVPWPDGFAIREKLEALRRQADEVDLLFVGSSIVHHGVRPAVLDPALAEAGLDVRSFNLGVGGMSAFEADHLLDEVLSWELPELDWVCVELRPFHGRIQGANAFTERQLRWHDPARTAAAMAVVLGDDRPLEARLTDAWTHLRLGARWLTNYGLGRTIVEAAVGPSHDAELADRLEASRGYLALEELAPDDPDVAARRQALLDDPQAFARGVASQDARNRSPVSPAAKDLAVLRDQQARIRAAGAEPLLFVPPSLMASPLAQWMAEEDEPDLYLFNSPRRFPALFQLEHHWDRNHLNLAGASLFSRDLAAALAPRLSGATPAQLRARARARRLGQDEGD